jgi:hypothetical protein
VDNPARRDYNPAFEETAAASRATIEAKGDRAFPDPREE